MAIFFLLCVLNVPLASFLQGATHKKPGLQRSHVSADTGSGSDLYPEPPPV